MDSDISLHDAPNIQHLTLSLFKKSNYSEEEYQLIEKSFKKIKELTSLRSSVIKLEPLEKKALDKLEKEFIIKLYSIIDHKKIAQIYLQSESLTALMAYSNIAVSLTPIVTILVILIFLPTIQLVSTLLIATLISLAVFFLINLLLFSDESVFLCIIKNQITLLMIQLENLIETSKDLNHRILSVEEEINSNDHILPAKEEINSDDSLLSNYATSFDCPVSIEEEINPDENMLLNPSSLYFKRLTQRRDSLFLPLPLNNEAPNSTSTPASSLASTPPSTP